MHIVNQLTLRNTSNYEHIIKVYILETYFLVFFQVNAETLI